MLVIVASRFDTPAHRLKDRWAGDGSCLLTPEDLSVSGWRYPVSDPHNSVAIIGGRDVKQSQIHGVLTRLQWVWETELLDISLDDRAYVSSEMSAFLLCWLSGLTCPVLNRPSTSCLTGPGWGLERWNFAASKAGMRVDPIHRRASLTNLAPTKVETNGERKLVEVTVVGNTCIGDVDRTLATKAKRLAEIAETDFLTVHFTGAQADATFAGVNVFPDIDTESVADAALGYFGRA
jgi:hypothetical protein